jgi:hypothetical protein
MDTNTNNSTDTTTTAAPEIVIESGIPIPPRGRGAGRTASESPISKALYALQVSQSIAVPKKSIHKLYERAKKNGFKYTARKVDSETVRVWRTA